MAHQKGGGEQVTAEWSGLHAVWQLSLWFGLLASGFELAILGHRKFIQGRLIGLGVDTLWMTPLADGLILLVAALLIVLIGRLWPRFPTFRVAVAAAGFLASCCVLFMFTRMAPWSVLLLATGIAVQITYLGTGHPRGFRTLVRRTLGWMVLLVILLGAGVTLWRGVTERRELAALGTRGGQSPNVVLLILDTVRASSLSLYGYQRPTTPNLDRLAHQGVLFDWAIAPAPWTLPSHASMFTGRWPHELSTGWRTPLDRTYPTLAEALRSEGYATAGFVANMPYGTHEHGLNRGFIHYEDYPLTLGQLALSCALGRAITNSRSFRRWIGFHDLLNRKSAADLNAAFLGWVGRQQRPFFGFLLYFDAHEPYLPPQPWRSRFGPSTNGEKIINLNNEAYHEDRWKLTPDGVAAEKNAYEGSIAYLDDQLGRLFDDMSRRGLLDNTIVIVAADHGEQHGEHQLFDHANSLYLPLLHVPLLILYPPRVPAGTRISTPVSLRDLPATVLGLAGLPGADSFPGRSLARFWTQGSGRESLDSGEALAEVKAGLRTNTRVPISKGDMRSLVLGRYHYILNGDGREELYDLRSDGNEEHDLSRAPEGVSLLPKFRAVLAGYFQRPAGSASGQRPDSAHLPAVP